MGLKDMVGGALGYSGCQICGKTFWNFDPDEWHPVSYDASYGVTIACEKCWRRSTLAQRHLAAEVLCTMWSENNTAEKMKVLRANIHEAVDNEYSPPTT